MNIFQKIIQFFKDIFGKVDPYENSPSILYKKEFDETVKNLNTSAKVMNWVQNLAEYNGSAVGWGNAEPGSTRDNAYHLAYHFWEKEYKGVRKTVGGVCGNFAGFFVYCMRRAGFKVGGVVYYMQRGSGVVGHIEGWAIEKDGRVTVISNDLMNHKSYNSIKDFKEAYDARLAAGEFTQLFYSDNMLNRLTDPCVYMGIN